MTLRPEDPKHQDESEKQVTTNDDAFPQIEDLAPRKPDPEREEQVKGGRFYTIE